MFLREAPTVTLREVADGLETETTESFRSMSNQVTVDLAETHSFRFAENELEIPATETGLKVFGDWLDIPTPFLLRLQPDLQQHILNELLRRNSAAGIFDFDDLGIKRIRDPFAKHIEPSQLVRTAIRVIDETAPVVEFRNNSDEFHLDAIAPEGFDRSIGGDLRIGDITRGGIRLHQNVKNNLAPSVSEFLYRLVCTNGMEIADESMKIDARGDSVEQVMAELEVLADQAFRRVEQSITAFYDLRSQPVENPERTVIRMAEEAGLPSRTALTLAERVPALIEDGETESITVFDLVNLISNQANAPSLNSKHGARRKLEVTGGEVVHQHVDRCSRCQSRLSN